MTGKIHSFSYGGNDYWQHKVVFDLNSNLIKVIWPQSDYEAKTHNCIIEQLKWNGRSTQVLNTLSYPWVQSEYKFCTETPKWKNIVKSLEYWKETKRHSVLNPMPKTFEECVYRGENFKTCNDEEFCFNHTGRGSASGVFAYWASDAAEKEAKKRNISCGLFQENELVKRFINQFHKSLTSVDRKMNLKILLADGAVADGLDEEAGVSGSRSNIIKETFEQEHRWPFGQYELNNQKTSFQCGGAEFVGDKWCSISLATNWSNYSGSNTKTIFSDIMLKAAYAPITDQEQAQAGMPGFHAYELKIIKLD